MHNEEFFTKRLAELRMRAGISARDMSLSMGQSEAYINKIESGQNLPSMTGFFYICEFLGIPPKEFFDDGLEYPQEIGRIVEKLKGHTKRQLSLLEALIDEMQLAKERKGGN